MRPEKKNPQSCVGKWTIKLLRNKGGSHGNSQPETQQGEIRNTVMCLVLHITSNRKKAVFLSSLFSCNWHGYSLFFEHTTVGAQVKLVSSKLLLLHASWSLNCKIYYKWFHAKFIWIKSFNKFMLKIPHK